MFHANMWRFLLILPLFVGLEATSKQTVFYDTYNGTPLTKEQMNQRIKANTTFWCTIEIEPCDPNEGRRLDGSCNNLDYPTRGAANTPFVKLLPREFAPGFNPRPSQSGHPLPLCRALRTTLLATGTRPDIKFTQLVTHFLVFNTGDITTVQDSVNYVFWNTHCCQPKGKSDPECTPQTVPNDDPVHRFSNIRCLNLTRPFSFQSRGCAKNDTAPVKISPSTPCLDLSQVYGNTLKEALEKGRHFSGGLLKYEVDEGRVYPPQTRTKENVCLLNQGPYETRCHDTPNVGVNAIVGGNLFGIWFWRNHNRIALTLADLNPCWDEERLFSTARDINIAIYVQIFLYELMPIMLGWNNLVEDSVVSRNYGFRDMYDKSTFPHVTEEFPYVYRWVHTMQEGQVKMYDTEGYYLKQIPIVNVTLRTGYIVRDNVIDYITQGSFRQPSGKIDDYVIDPQIGETIFGALQVASDVATSDLAKGRYSGFPPYAKYREYCSGRSINTFDDLGDFIDAGNLDLLKDKYDHVNDVELMAGLWMEKHVEGGFVPPTFYCVVVDQILRSIRGDRHWYERPNRPNAFTMQQLQEVRKATVSELLCNVADKVTQIQRRGFERAGPKNKMVSCKNIVKMDLTAWEDHTYDDQCGILE